MGFLPEGRSALPLAPLSGPALDSGPCFHTPFAQVATMVRSRPSFPVGQGQVRSNTVFLAPWPSRRSEGIMPEAYLQEWENSTPFLEKEDQLLSKRAANICIGPVLLLLLVSSCLICMTCLLKYASPSSSIKRPLNFSSWRIIPQISFFIPFILIASIWSIKIVKTNAPGGAYSFRLFITTISH